MGLPVRVPRRVSPRSVSGDVLTLANDTAMWRDLPSETTHDHSWCFVDLGEALVALDELELDGKTYCIFLDATGVPLVSVREYALSRAR